MAALEHAGPGGGGRLGEAGGAQLIYVCYQERHAAGEGELDERFIELAVADEAGGEVFEVESLVGGDEWLEWLERVDVREGGQVGVRAEHDHVGWGAGGEGDAQLIGECVVLAEIGRASRRERV